MTLPIFKPFCMDFFKITSTFYSILSLILFGYVALLIISKRDKLALVTRFIILIELIVLFSTLFNHGSLGNAFYNIISILYVALLIDWCVKNKLAVPMIKSMMLHLELCTYINLFTLLIGPNGFFYRSHIAYGTTQEWLLGSDHYFVIWAIPSFLISWIYKEYTGNTVRSYLLIIMTGLTQLIRGSTTGLVGVAIFFAWLLLPVLRRIITPFRGMIVISFLCLSIVILQQSDFLNPIIVGVLGKDMTYTNRLGIWNNAIQAILTRPLTGYGILYNEQTVDLLGVFSNGFRWEGAVHCHCQYLQVAFESGITGLILYMVSIVSALLKSHRCKNKNLSQSAMVCIFILGIISITEVYEYPLMYMLFILPFYSEELCIQLMLPKTNKVVKLRNNSI